MQAAFGAMLWADIFDERPQTLQCSVAEVYDAAACDDDTLHLASCPTDHVINLIMTGFYGRSDDPRYTLEGHCPVHPLWWEIFGPSAGAWDAARAAFVGCKDRLGAGRVYAEPTQVVDFVSAACIGKASCSVPVRSVRERVGDPCRGVRKWASITYTCAALA